MRKWRFRTTLLAILLGLLTLTIGSLGILSASYLITTTRDLSEEVLEQSALSVKEHIEGKLHSLEAQVMINCGLVEDGIQSLDRKGELLKIWMEVMKAHPNFSRMAIANVESGEWFLLRRGPKHHLTVFQLQLNPMSKDLELTAFAAEDFDKKPHLFDPHSNKEHAGSKFWVKHALAHPGPSFTEAHIFGDTDRTLESAGIGCVKTALPPKGSPTYVLGVGYDLIQMSAFLKELRPLDQGLVFVVEQLSSGERFVVGHPDANLLLQEIASDQEAKSAQLTTQHNSKDPRVRAFLNQIPEGISLQTSEMTLVHFEVEGEMYRGAYRPLHIEAGPPWIICLCIPDKAIVGPIQAHTRSLIITGIIVLALAIVITLLVTGQVASKLENLAREAGKIGTLRVKSGAVQHSFVYEVDQLGEAVEEMKTSLRSFQKYVPADLIRAMLATGQEAVLGGEQRSMTVFFSDIAGFTSLAESVSPELLIIQLSEYFQAFSEAILAEGGTVDKYIGDAVMAFWNAPAIHPDHAMAACRAALECQRRLMELRKVWIEKGQPPVHARIGINTGPVIVGNVGSEARLNYTVIGDAVNLASRLEGLNKLYDTTVLISEYTHQAVTGGLLTRPLDYVSVKGKTTGIVIYEVVALKNESTPALEELIALTTAAFARYRLRDWMGAIALYDQILKQWPHDVPSRILGERCREYQANPPGETWDGVYHMHEK